MIYVTGDIHGNISRFEDKAISQLKRGDYLIVCGDFGFIWEGTRQEEKVLNFLARQRYAILFVDGCHENFDRLQKYPVTEWNGGKVRRIKQNIIHLMRGQVYEIEGKRIFTMGGGCSSDLELRQLRGTKWWPEETPSTEEMAEGVDNLFRYNLTVDYIITHECPTKVKNLLVNELDNFNSVTAFFDEVCQQVKYKHWFFGSVHKDMHLSSAHTALFQRILPLEVPGSRKAAEEEQNTKGGRRRPSAKAAAQPQSEEQNDTDSSYDELRAGYRQRYGRAGRAARMELEGLAGEYESVAQDDTLKVSYEPEETAEPADDSAGFDDWDSIMSDEMVERLKRRAPDSDDTDL
ncbi:MAG: hypothetical protein E7546_06415 [Ruminococcaceae bacterium]|nr:hypothetical protein [Oscillospiraceae bacterium]